MDRGRPGTKPALLADRRGVPLATRTAGADASDHTPIIPLVPDLPRVGGKPGRPKELPDEWYAERGRDRDATRWVLRWPGTEPHIATRKTPHGCGPGKARWGVGRTSGWLEGLRRVRVRDGRLGVVQDAFTTPAAGVGCFKIRVNDRC